MQEEGIVIIADFAAQVRKGINASRWINVDEDAEKRIATALTQTASVNFIEEPLENALAVLAQQHQIEIEINRRALEEIGLTPDEPVTVSLKNVKLESALKAILEPNDLTFTVRHERLHVLTREADEAQLLVRIYWLEGIGIPQQAHVQIMTLIQTTLQPDTWDSLGGPSSMAPMTQTVRPALMVATTYEVHQQIETFLARLAYQQMGGGGSEGGGGNF